MLFSFSSGSIVDPFTLSHYLQSLQKSPTSSARVEAKNSFLVSSSFRINTNRTAPHSSAMRRRKIIDYFRFTGILSLRFHLLETRFRKEGRLRVRARITKRRFVRAIRSTTWLDASPNERTNERDPHYDHTICCVLFTVRISFEISDEEGKIRRARFSFSFPES